MTERAKAGKNEAFKEHCLWRENQDLLTYQQWAIKFKARLNQALQTWLGQVGYAAGLLLKSLRDKAAQWWYFLDDPSVPLDNNECGTFSSFGCN